jgi:hypothetical protein
MASSEFSLVTAATTNITMVKTGYGKLMDGFIISDFSQTPGTGCALKFYDTATAPTVGTTPIKLTVPMLIVPSTDVNNTNAMTPIIVSQDGMSFTKGLYIATTLAVGASSTNALTGANWFYIHLFFE